MNTTRDVCIGTAILGSMLIGLHTDAEISLLGFVKAGAGAMMWTGVCMIIFHFLGSQKL